MVKRIDKVYQKLLEIWQNASKDQILSGEGSSAQEIASALQLTRSNASLELNKLVRAQKLIKVKTYPVKYFPTILIEELFETTISQETEVKSLQELLAFDHNNKSVKVQRIKKNPFDRVIGHDGSLKKPISQAKAAVYYPPFGLHMLLLGPTGSGKTFFANRIFEYAKYENIFPEEAPFESFNCADYYHNPQLLLSHLFGYCKGAFTGAEEDHAGLVEQVDGGILLLDEVHRLPPEGQEMLFYFIDNGTFNRLGENNVKRHAKVLIICATTENPSSALLGTFLRRIPMTIMIPSLRERSIKERVELIKFLFGNESKRIQKTMRINIDVFSALIQAANFGNVGQLKSHVQLICAQAFLNNLHQTEEIEIRLRDLPAEIQSDWASSRTNLEKAKELSGLISVMTVIYPEEQASLSNEEFNEFNIYESIEEKVKVLMDQGIDEEKIHQYILTDLHLYIRNFVKENSANYNLLKFVDKKIPMFAEGLKKIAERELDCHFDRRFIYYIGMHIDAYLRRGKQSNILIDSEIEEVKREHDKEYQVALLFKQEIKNEFNLLIPEIEVIYLTMLIASIETLDETQKVSVLVVAHGNTTATSMVEVATDLLGAAPIEALNMPLTLSPQELFEAMVEKVKALDCGKGVLMLVDMGSPAMMGERLEQTSGVKIKTIPNVTTSIVLDVVRKINYMDLDLNAVYDSVKKDFFASIHLHDDSRGKPKAILSICTTGSGTAKKIEGLITNIIYDSTDDAIQVLTVSALKLKEKIPELLEKFQIIASVGTKDPKIDAPHISLEYLIEGTGEEKLKQMIGVTNLPLDKTGQKNIVVKDLCEDTLKTYLVYLNPYHVTDMLLEWVSDLGSVLGVSFPNSQIIKLVVHTAFVFERVIKQTPLSFEETVSKEVSEILDHVEESLRRIEEGLQLKVSKDEKIFIAEMLIDDKSVSEL